MLRSVFTKWLWDSRRSVFGWTLAIVGVGGGYAAFWPIIDDPQMQNLLTSYPQSLREAMGFEGMSTAAGYLTATVYGLIVAVLLLVYAVSAGARLIAGDEEGGTLDLVAAHPVRRSRLALERFGAFLTALVMIIGALWLAMLALIVPAQLDGISVGQFAAMHVHLLLFAAVFGALTYAVGAATGRKSLALGIGAGVGVFGYAARGLLPQVDGLEWTKNLSPFQWLSGGKPLLNGLQIGDSLLMPGLIVVLVAVGTWAFSRRDIRV